MDVTVSSGASTQALVYQSREEEYVFPVIEAPRPATKAALHGK